MFYKNTLLNEQMEGLSEQMDKAGQKLELNDGPMNRLSAEMDNLSAEMDDLSEKLNDNFQALVDLIPNAIKFKIMECQHPNHQKHLSHFHRRLPRQLRHRCRQNEQLIIKLVTLQD